MIVVLSLALFLSAAQAEEDYCSSGLPSQLIKEVPVPGSPSYFMRAFRDRNMVSLGSDQGNILVDLDSGKVTPVPGIYDPVPLPNGSSVSIPGRMEWNPEAKSFDAVSAAGDPSANYAVKTDGGIEQRARKTGNGRVADKWVDSKLTEKDLIDRGLPYSMQALTFYDAQDLIANGSKAKLQSFDRQMSGVYQSTGRANGNEAIQRVIMETDRLRFRDYDTFRDSENNPNIRPRGESKTLCPGLILQLPMLSKSGNELAGFDEKTKKTNVYSIDERTGACRLVDSLPLRTGKVDFGWNGNKLAFHIDPGSQSNAYFGTPSKDQSLRVYVYDRSGKGLVEIQKPENTNAYYPVFLKNGDVAYISEDKSKSQNKFSVRVVRPNYGFENRRELCAKCGEPRLKNALALIGGHVTNKCGSEKVTIDDAVLRAVNLPEATCRRLVQDAWNNREQASGMFKFPDFIGFGGGGKVEIDYSQFASSDLERACAWRAGDGSPATKGSSVR